MFSSIPKSIKNHPKYTKRTYQRLKGNGLSNDQILRYWNKEPSPPHTYNGHVRNARNSRNLWN